MSKGWNIQVRNIHRDPYRRERSDGQRLRWRRGSLRLYTPKRNQHKLPESRGDKR